jgi:L-cysteine desulfidase
LIAMRVAMTSDARLRGAGKLASAISGSGLSGISMPTTRPPPP